MWAKLVEILKTILDTLAPLFIAKEWGEEVSKRKQAEANVKEKERYEKIDNNPDVSRPLGRMRHK
jgi:hypothetical protein